MKRDNSPPDAILPAARTAPRVGRNKEFDAVDPPAPSSAGRRSTSPEARRVELQRQLAKPPRHRAAPPPWCAGRTARSRHGVTAAVSATAASSFARPALPPPRSRRRAASEPRQFAGCTPCLRAIADVEQPRFGRFQPLGVIFHRARHRAAAFRLVGSIIAAKSPAAAQRWSPASRKRAAAPRRAAARVCCRCPRTLGGSRQGRPRSFALPRARLDSPASSPGCGLVLQFSDAMFSHSRSRAASSSALAAASFARQRATRAPRPPRLFRRAQAPSRVMPRAPAAAIVVLAVDSTMPGQPQQQRRRTGRSFRNARLRVTQGATESASPGSVDVIVREQSAAGVDGRCGKNRGHLRCRFPAGPALSARAPSASPSASSRIDFTRPVSPVSTPSPAANELEPFDGERYWR